VLSDQTDQVVLVQKGFVPERCSEAVEEEATVYS
ncbi:MAG: cytochrome oxidase assembly protein ShyY1, partial [Flavobacteriales bacterium]